MRLFKTFIAIFTILFVAGSIGCSTANIARRGIYVDENTIEKGMSRDEVLSILGAPIESRSLENNKTKDFFKLEQGDTAGGKFAKGFASSVVAIGTHGISEFVTIPVTKKRADISVVVWYDQNEIVEKTQIIEARQNIPDEQELNE